MNNFYFRFSKAIFFTLFFCSLEIKAAPDLIIANPYRHMEIVSAGTHYRMSCYMQNTGDSTNQTFNLGFYFSIDSIFDLSDVLMKDTSINSVPGGSSFYIVDYPEIPNGALPGEYFILFVADFQNQILEVDENNNVSALPVTVAESTVDIGLSGYFISVPNSNQIYTYYNTHNYGNHQSGIFRIGTYLSIDMVVDSSDYFLYGYLYQIDWGSHWSWGHYAQIPAGFPGGTYYVITYCDDKLQEAETNEQNNIYYQQVYIPPGPTIVLPEPESVAVAIFPNPASDQIRIEGNQLTNISIHNSTGQLMAEIKPTGFQTNLSLQDFPEGNYIITMSSDQGIHRKKFIVQH